MSYRLLVRGEDRTFDALACAGRFLQKLSPPLEFTVQVYGGPEGAMQRAFGGTAGKDGIHYNGWTAGNDLVRGEMERFALCAGRRATYAPLSQCAATDG